MAPLPIPFPQNNDIYLTAISVVVAIVFESRIREFVDRANGRFLRFYALIIAIVFVFSASLFIFVVLNFAAMLAPLLSSVLRIGNNYGTVFYVIAILILTMKPFLGERTHEKIRYLWTSKELVVAVIFFILGWIVNNFFTKP